MGNSKGIVKRLRIETIRSEYALINEFINGGETLEEEWKRIYIDGEKSSYLISSKGRVKRTHYFFKGKCIKKEYILKPNIMNTGYAIVCLCHNKKHYWKTIHRLVAIYFIEIPEELKKKGYTFDDLEVNHKEGSFKGKSNNDVSNLEWSTSSENKIHAYNTGLKKRGEDSIISVYTNDQIHEVCRLLEENELTNRQIWKKTNVSVNTIQAILSKKQWKHISCDYDFTNHKKRHELYDIETKNAAIELLKTTTLSCKEIGDRVGMTRNSVWALEKSIK